MKRYTNEYVNIHRWIYYHYGKADHCENKDCKGEGKRFEWAHLNGSPWTKDIKNFIQLCSKCHFEYDEGRKEKAIKTLLENRYYIRTEEEKNRLRKARLGSKWSDEQREKRKKYIVSDETKDKLRKAAINQWKKIKKNV